MGKDKNKDKEHHDGETAATSKTNSPWDAHWDSFRDVRDLSQDCKTRDATLAQTIAEAVTREMAKAHAHYQAILNERSTATLQTSLKVSSGANGFKVMDPFDWTKDKSTRDGNCGQKRLDSPLMPWREIQRRPRFLTSIIGSMEREWDTGHGKTAKPSSASLHMMH